MADEMDTRECVECGDEYEVDPYAGMPPKRCSDCEMEAFRETVSDLRDGREDSDV